MAGRDAGGQAERLLRGAVLGLALLPPGMVVAHRSAPLFLSVAAVLAVAGVAASGALGRLGASLRAALSGPLGVAVLLFGAAAALSTGWSPDGLHGARSLAEFALPIGGSLLLGLALRGRLPAGSGAVLAAGLLLASALIVLDLSTGMAFRRAAGLRPDSFVLNRPALTLVALLPAAILLCRSEGRRGLGLVAAAAVAIAVFRSDSGAARLGLLALGAAASVALLSRRFAAGLAAAGLLLAIAFAPVMGEFAERALPDGLHRALSASHARDRVDIWLAFGAAIREAPFLGHGFDASPRLGAAPVAERLDPAHGAYLAVGHPHSAPVQVWTELGALGAGLAGTIALLLVPRLQALRRADAAASFGLLSAAFSVSLVGHGAWQGWWPAAIGSAAALIAARPSQTGT